MASSFCACTYYQKSDDISYNIDCHLVKTFIRVDTNQMVIPQYLFFSCNIKNNTADTLNWYYLGFNKGYLGRLSSDYVSKAFIRLKSGEIHYAYIKKVMSHKNLQELCLMILANTFIFR